MNTNDTNKMEFVYFGTDEFAVKVLEQLKVEGLVPALIVTTPGHSNRRGVAISSPVEKWAKSNGNAFATEAKTLEAKSYKLFLVASYGKILPPSILDLPEHGVLNIHPSLLPKYRGPSPLQSAILNGDQETGVTIIKLDEKMDHGPILAASSFELLASSSFEQLRDTLAKMGAELFAKILPDYLAGKIAPVEQTHDQATYTKKFTKADAELKPSDPVELNYRKVLALNPEPGTWLIDDNNTRLKILSAHLEPPLGGEAAKLIFDRVIPEGKKEMDWESYQRGKKI